ncbi:Cache domain-containing protein [Natronincola peptidivorans]|uniref:Cache domain-containing protein n=1 Tax=Natronincola peptidivorans TaxID=426128 RepID=A0A1I0BJ24_9FIRM|nr:Cache 3/Cache 2 fusion domain-containing protein [Natronincola peptidivorans]SET06635.1 Cache domain-containing protein [Natronincola peptidivorans]
MKLRTKIIITYILLIVVTTGILGFFAINHSQETLLRQEEEKIQFAVDSIYTLIDMRQELIQEQITNNLNVSMKLLIEEYGDIAIDRSNLVTVGEYTVPTLYAGELNLTEDNTFVDELKELMGGTSTVFVLNDNKFVRVSTNVRMEDGARAIGTVIDADSPVYQSVINKEPYYSRAWVVNNWYITAYKPLLDANNNVTGMLYAGVPEIDEKLEGIFSNVKIGQTGHLYIMDSSGDLLYHPTMQGENIAEYGYVQDIFDIKHGSMEFQLDNNATLAKFQYFEPWDWYVVAKVNIHDIKSNAQGVINFIITIGLVVFVLAMGIMVNQKVNKIDRENKEKNEKIDS